MSQTHFDPEAARQNWRDTMEKQRVAALADPAWNGRTAQLDLQIELGEVMGVIAAATMRAQNGQAVTVGEIAGSIGIVLGSVLHFVRSNYGDAALLVATRQMEFALDVHASGRLPEAGLMSALNVRAAAGGRA